MVLRLRRDDCTTGGGIASPEELLPESVAIKDAPAVFPVPDDDDDEDWQCKWLLAFCTLVEISLSVFFIAAVRFATTGLRGFDCRSRD